MKRAADTSPSVKMKSLPNSEAQSHPQYQVHPDIDILSAQFVEGFNFHQEAPHPASLPPIPKANATERLALWPTGASSAAPAKSSTAPATSPIPHGWSSATPATSSVALAGPPLLLAQPPRLVQTQNTLRSLRASGASRAPLWGVASSPINVFDDVPPRREPAGEERKTVIPEKADTVESGSVFVPGGFTSSPRPPLSRSPSSPAPSSPTPANRTPTSPSQYKRSLSVAFDPSVSKLSPPATNSNSPLPVNTYAASSPSSTLSPALGKIPERSPSPVALISQAALLLQAESSAQEREQLIRDVDLVSYLEKIWTREPDKKTLDHFRSEIQACASQSEIFKVITRWASAMKGDIPTISAHCAKLLLDPLDSSRLNLSPWHLDGHSISTMQRERSISAPGISSKASISAALSTVNQGRQEGVPGHPKSGATNSHGKKFRFWTSSSPAPIEKPNFFKPKNPTQRADIYLHWNTADQAWQAWLADLVWDDVRREDVLTWIDITWYRNDFNGHEPLAHPTLPDLFLVFRPDATPNFIKGKSMTTYKNGFPLGKGSALQAPEERGEGEQGQG
ncbi:hypothetical protein NLJ89_g2649 [Agrocybe chaxingu]|uniref:Uncharacterized protein n=1 Tax=Agrocybe chaxingu TaxID=84603 RepID=A0A9W8MXH9_9AGAR|nr:hypothetical protein NLJ89_g2649 [Agrocybe chaxingu]